MYDRGKKFEFSRGSVVIYRSIILTIVFSRHSVTLKAGNCRGAQVFFKKLSKSFDAKK